MQHKIVAITGLLLLPIISLDGHNKSNEPIKGFENSNVQKNVQIRDIRIKEIESNKLQMEAEVVQLESHILKEKEIALNLMNVLMYYYWKPTSQNSWWMSQNDKAKAFDEFVLELSNAFERGEDTEPMVNKAPFCNSGDDAHYLCMKYIVRKIYLDRKVREYKQKVEELRTVNRELNNLKSE